MPSDAPSPDALDAAGVLSPERFARLLGYYRSGRGGEYDAAGDTLLAHDAAVRRLAEQGEGGQEMIVSADVGGYPAILLEKWHNLKPGDKVLVRRVTRIEEAP